METKHKNLSIDPIQSSYCFTFSNRDCYKLVTGRCTFELSNEEFIKESAKFKHSTSYEARVGYCREIYQSMAKNNIL